MCVLSEEPKPGRNETVWVHMRKCLHKCNRTQVRPATNEGAEEIETATSSLPSLTEADREGHTRHFADISDEGSSDGDEPMVVEGGVMDVCLGRPDSQPEPELNAPANSNAPSRSARSEAHAKPEAEVTASAGTDMEIEVGDRRVRFRGEGDSSRHQQDVSSDWESMEGPRGKMPRRAETSESVVPFPSSEASSSELQQVSTADASDNPTGERLYMSMTEEGPSGDNKMRMQRDQHGRWMPTKGEGTMNIQKAREEKRSFYVGERKKHGTFSIASAEASSLHGKFYLSRRNADEVSWNRLSTEDRTQFLKAIKTERKGVLEFKAVTITDPTQADVIGEKQRERMSFSRLVVRWKETDIGYLAKARWYVHGCKDPYIHEIERSCPMSELSPIITLQVPASTTSEGTLADGEEALMQGDPGVQNEPLYATPVPGRLPFVPEGALIRLDREAYGKISGMPVWRLRIVSQLKEEGYEMNIYEPCLFSKFAVREEKAVDEGSIAPGELVGCVLLEVDDHLMGGPGKAPHESMETLRQRIKFGKWHGLIQDGPSFFGGRHFTQLLDRSFKVDMTRFLQERLRPISLPRGRCLDRSAEATEGKVKALRAVAGSLSWVARQCRPDEAGTASTLQVSVSRAVVKDLSDANRAENRLKQAEDVGLLIHAIPLANLRTEPISCGALDLDRPDGSTQGGFMVGFTTSALHQQGSAVMSPMSWSSHKVKRCVSASLAGEVFMTSEGLAECEWISGVLESAVYQDYEPSRQTVTPRRTPLHAVI